MGCSITGELSLSISAPSTRFELAKAADSYGYLYLAPNEWDKERARLSRPLYMASREGEEERVALVNISQEGVGTAVIVNVSKEGDVPTRTDDWRAIATRVIRMLRMDEGGFEDVYWGKGTATPAPAWARARGLFRERESERARERESERERKGERERESERERERERERES